MPTAYEPPRGFSQQEYETRTAKAQALMASDGMDALLLTTKEDIHYFTGFLTQFWQSPTRPWFVVVPADGKPIAVIPEIGAALMARGWIEDIRTWPAPQPDDDGVSLLAATLGDVVGGGAVGLPMGGETHLHMPLASFAGVQSALPETAFADATGIIRRLRMTKSEAEIAKIRHVCGVGSDTFDSLATALQAGMTGHDVCRHFRRQALALGADDVPFLAFAAGPGGYDDIISPPSGRALQPGDLMILDNGCVFDGYFCDFDRNFAIGHADDLTIRAYDTCYRATDAGIAAARPGATCRDLFTAMSDVLEAGGALGNDVGRLGHGLGLQLTEPPSHAAFDDTVLEAGMVITIEPGMTFAPGRMMVHEENIVVRDGEAELLTRRAARELPVVG